MNDNKDLASHLNIDGMQEIRLYSGTRVGVPLSCSSAWDFEALSTYLASERDLWKSNVKSLVGRSQIERRLKALFTANPNFKAELANVMMSFDKSDGVRLAFANTLLHLMSEGVYDDELNIFRNYLTSKTDQTLEIQKHLLQLFEINRLDMSKTMLTKDGAGINNAYGVEHIAKHLQNEKFEGTFLSNLQNMKLVNNLGENIGIKPTLDFYKDITKEAAPHIKVDLYAFVLSILLKRLENERALGSGNGLNEHFRMQLEDVLSILDFSAECRDLHSGFDRIFKRTYCTIYSDIFGIAEGGVDAMLTACFAYNMEVEIFGFSSVNDCGQYMEAYLKELVDRGILLDKENSDATHYKILHNPLFINTGDTFRNLVSHYSFIQQSQEINDGDDDVSSSVSQFTI